MAVTMALLDRIVSRRSATLSAPPRWLLDSLGVGGKHIGETVTVDKAMGLVPVFSAVTRISGDIGKTPVIVYRGRERASDEWSWRLLHDWPNPEMAADELVEIVTEHLLLWGNAFLFKKYGPSRAAGPEELWPLSPRRCSVGRVDGVKTYFVDNVALTDEHILHIRGLSEDGVVGYSPIQLTKQALANAMAQEKFVAEFLKDGGRPNIILRHPQKLTPEAAKRLKAAWDRVENGGTAVLEEDINVERWTMPLSDAQFIEQQQFSDVRIAQMFNLPAAKLSAKTGDSLTYATVEGGQIEYLTGTLDRWFSRIEKSFTRDPSIVPRGQKAEFLREAILRSDSKTRAEVYALALDPEKGWMVWDEVRQRENLDEIPKPALSKEESNEDPE